MDTDKLKDMAAGLAEKAQKLSDNPKVQDAVAKGKEYVDMGIEKGKEFLDSPQAKEYQQKGKEMLDKAKDKVEDFVADKTDGKGIFGFGAK